MTPWPPSYVIRQCEKPLSTPMTASDTVLDSIFGFIAASPADRRLPLKASAVGKQPVHPISGRLRCSALTASDFQARPWGAIYCWRRRRKARSWLHRGSDGCPFERTFTQKDSIREIMTFVSAMSIRATSNTSPYRRKQSFWDDRDLAFTSMSI
jgi:hypothetical protein